MSINEYSNLLMVVNSGCQEKGILFSIREMVIR